MEKKIIENEKEAFKVPEGYFEGFEERLMARIKEEEKIQEPIRKANIRQLWINRSAIAVGIAGLILIGMATIIKIEDEIDEKAQQIMTVKSVPNDAYYEEINEELSSEEIEDALAQIEFGDEEIY